MMKLPKDRLSAYSQFSGNAELLRDAVADANTLQGLNLSVADLNERVIRYYATEGVIDKPDRVGRDAIYQFRHLLQILVCRLLQSEGFSIAQIATFNQSTPTDDLRARLVTAQPRQSTKAQDLIRQFRQGGKPDASGGLMKSRSPTGKHMSALADQDDATVLFSRRIEAEEISPKKQSSTHTTGSSAEPKVERQPTPALHQSHQTPSIPAVDLHAALEGVRNAMRDVQQRTEYQHRELMDRMHRAFKDIERIGEQMHHLEKEQRNATAKLNEQMEKLLEAVDATRSTRKASNTSNTSTTNHSSKSGESK